MILDKMTSFGSKKITDMACTTSDSGHHSLYSHTHTPTRAHTLTRTHTHTVRSASSRSGSTPTNRVRFQLEEARLRFRADHVQNQCLRPHRHPTL